MLFSCSLLIYLNKAVHACVHVSVCHVIKNQIYKQEHHLADLYLIYFAKFIYMYGLADLYAFILTWGGGSERSEEARSAKARRSS